MFDSKDFGEDLDGVYGTSLIVFDVAKKEARVIGAPPGHTACQFSWASGNVIILQAVDISGARPLAVRSYDNRPYHLFAVKVDAESVEFKPLLDQSKIYLWPGATQIEGGLARVFYSRFIDGFGGHAGPSHPGTFVIDLETLEVRDAKEMPDSIDIQHVTSAPFVDSGHVLITQRKRCRWFPAVIDLETFEVKELIPDELGQKSAVAEDVRGDAVILRIATPIETPRFALLKAGRLTFLTQSTTFGQYAFEVVFNDNMNDAILILAPGDTKKFIVSPHGGPCGMFSTYFSRYYAFFYLNGYSLCLVNYRGSTGYPAEVQKSLPGHCSELDADDVLFHIDRVRSLFTVSKLALWGWSHGGYVTTAVAGRYPDKIDCAVAGAPVTNFVGTYYTSDIPDWSLVESGVRIEPDAEIDIDERSLAALLKCSSVRYARDVKAPILLIHGRADRRVPLGQSLDYFYALRRHQKQVKLIIYDAPGHSMSVPETWDDTMLASVAFFEDPVGFIEHDYLAPDPPASA
jgi:acylaminoacyl-peptidase